jgi:hypothetical protein
VRLCQGCLRFGTCTTSSKGRRVERPFNEAVRERLESRYQRPDARALMRRRKERAEHPFGHIKHNLGMRSYLVRGLSGARAEASLAATAFNLRRMTTLLGAHGLTKKLRGKSMWKPCLNCCVARTTAGPRNRTDPSATYLLDCDTA